MPPRTLHLLVEGRVQGVGYRAFAQETALRLGLSGWVRNRRDGRVETLVHGPADALEAFLTAARIGPPAAEVAEVTIVTDAAPAPAAGFHVVKTV
ncbi:MAG: acylphosphatase [Alphaproteobacteria bacterium]|nr:acylphosphatase [Alphaproteobacteria bacterium]